MVKNDGVLPLKRDIGSVALIGPSSAAQKIGGYSSTPQFPIPSVYEELKAALLKTAARLDGSYALGIICADKPQELVAIRNASPLVVGLGVGENFFASDVTALLPYTRSILELEDGEIAKITPDEVTVLDSTGRRVAREAVRVTWSREAAEKGGYDHFMLKEIMEQPSALKAAIDPRVKNGRVCFEELESATRPFAAGRFNRVLLTGCGSAYHAASVARYTFEALAKLPCEAEIASELRYRDAVIDEQTLVVVISQSGETADTIAAAKECQRRGAYVISIVNVVGSTLAKLADATLYTFAGPEISVATTKGYTTQLAVLALLGVYLARARGAIDEERCNRLVGELGLLPSKCQRAIDLNRMKAVALAGVYHAKRSLFYIGRNLDYAVCMEASLKLKEISYIHSEAYAAGELKHGTIALIDEDQLVIALACCERLFDKLLSNVREVKARGARVLGVVREGERRIYTEADDALLVPETDELLIPIIEIVPLQMFAYCVARENGCDIDKPKNLAKSVTVE